MHTLSRFTSLAAATALVLATSCDKKSSSKAEAPKPLSTIQAGAGHYQESRWDPGSPRRGPRPPQRRFGPERAGQHILIAYKGARRAKPAITRTKEQARAKAVELTALLKKHPERFAELAKKSSDGPTGRRGGYLGTWPRGRMVPAFDKAIDGLKEGQVTGPVETPFGFHVIKRIGTLYAGRHILIAYKGASRAKPTITRTKEQAKALAEKITAEAKKTPTRFADLAKKYSDGPSGPKGGSLGKWKPGRMVPAFQAAVEGLPIGGITAHPVETPFGFHVIQRADPKTMGR